MKKIILWMAFFVVCSAPVHALPEIQKWTTDDGVDVLYVHAPELPMLDIVLTIDAGSVRDGKLGGLSQLTHGLLDSGAGDLNADAIAAKFEDVGAQFGTSVSVDRSSISLRSLTDPKLLQQALATYREIIANPTFPEDDFKRLKAQLLISLRNQQQRPGSIASKQFYETLYKDHPFSQPTSGDQESVEAITRQDVKDFYKRYVIKENAVLAMVGAVDRKQAEKIANDISTALASGKAASELSTPERGPETEEFVAFPSQQAHVFIGQVGIKRGDPDYFALYVGNHILGGGGFTSRLMKQVRSERGLSYSVYSYFTPLREAGPFVLGLQTRIDQAREAIDVSHAVVKEFVENGPTQEELDLAKQSIIGGFPLRMDSNRDILGYLGVIGFYDLPLTYLNDFPAKVEALSLEDIRDAFQRRVEPEKLVTVTVGGETAP